MSTRCLEKTHNWYILLMQFSMKDPYGLKNHWGKRIKKTNKDP